MKIDSITIERFGIYENRTFHFGYAPLVVIYGPNETGKTTALSAFRQSMFGFDHNPPYETKARFTKARVRGLLKSNNDCLEFSWRKANKDPFEGTLAGHPIKASDFAPLLGNFDADTYKSFFAFSLEELREGEKVLKNARFSEALAGGGFGSIAKLQALQARFNETLTTLGVRNPGAKKLIPAKCKELQNAKAELKNKEMTPTSVRELIKTRQASEDEARQLRERMESIRTELLLMQSVLSVLPDFGKRRALNEQLAQLETPENIDRPFQMQWQKVNEDLETAVRELAVLEKEFDSVESQLALLSTNNQWSSVKHLAESIVASQSKIESLLQGRAADERAIEQAKTKIEQSLGTLGIEQISPELLSTPISAQLKSNVERIQSDSENLAKEIVAITAKLDQVRQQLQNAASEYSNELQTTDLDALNDRLAQCETLQRQIADLDNQVNNDRGDKAYTARMWRLARSIMQERMETSWSLPPQHLIDQFVDTSAHYDEMESTIKRQMAEGDDQVAELEQKLQNLATYETDQLFVRIRSLADDRDQLVQAWLDELMLPLSASSVSPEIQQERLKHLQSIFRESDASYESMLGAAEQVAQYKQLQAQVAQLNERHTRLEASHAELHEKRSALERQWRDHWANLPFDPLPISLTRDWMKEFEVWREAAMSIEHSELRIKQLQSELKLKHEQLVQVWPAEYVEGTPLNTFRRQMQEWLDARQRKVEQERAKADQIRSAADLERQLAKLQSDERNLAESFRNTFPQLDVAIQVTIANGSQVLNNIKQLREEWNRKSELELRVEDAIQQIDEFTKLVQQLAVAVEFDCSFGTVIDHAKQLHSQYSAWRDSQQNRVELEVLHSEKLKGIERLRAKVSGLKSQQRQLIQQCGCESIEQIDALIESYEQAIGIHSQVRELTVRIDSKRGSLSATEFDQLLSNSDEAKVTNLIHNLRIELENAEQLRDQMKDRVQQVTSEIGRVTNNVEVQTIVQKVATIRSELTELGDQFVIHTLATQLLSQAIERFARENEPELLKYIRRYFSSLTGGKYTEVEHEPNESKLIVRTEDGKAFSVEELSTGAREQLYLALRMAFISNHADHHETLPVVMDDCFVNFDDERTGLALSTILQWDADVQTIVLSCHSRVIHALAEIAPQTPVIALDRSENFTAESLVQQWSREGVTAEA